VTPRELLRQTAARFRAAQLPDPEVDGAVLLSHVLGFPALTLRLDTDTQLTPAQLDAYEALCAQRLRRTPLQYLTHEQSFLGRSFYVDDRVLIPRPETELLAERAIDALRRRGGSPSALDLCCGSGCLAVSLALGMPAAEVDAADLSPGALDVTRRNAEVLAARVGLYQGDLFQAVADRRYDLIVSNPPYIPSHECPLLQAEVLREPRMALSGGPDGLDFYRRIAMEAPDHLLPGGLVLMEVGWNQGETVRALMADAGFPRTAVYPDLQGIPRIVEAEL